MSINGSIDLRSDTLTIPTPAMREAMATADVGDDVFAEDPSINKLQEMAAAMLGQEAGLLVTSGTMGNLTAMLTHCARGNEAILGDQCHILNYEQGGIAALGAIMPRPLPTQPDGSLRLEDINAAIRSDDQHFAVTRVIALENTHNRMGGAVQSAAYIKQVAELAHSRGIKLHIDGARIFNAAAALGVPVSELTQHADSVTFCLSKGLSAPVGSVLVGSREFIARAHRARKVLGGGMRQAGVIAAAGIVALEQMTGRLGEDHANARALAEGIATIPGLIVDVKRVPTNMVYFDLDPALPFDAKTLCQRAASLNVKMLPTTARRIRAVTHAWVNRQEIDEATQAIRHATLNDNVTTGTSAGIRTY